MTCEVLLRRAGKVDSVFWGFFGLRGVWVGQWVWFWFCIGEREVVFVRGWEGERKEFVKGVGWVGEGVGFGDGGNRCWR